MFGVVVTLVSILFFRLISKKYLIIFSTKFFLFSYSLLPSISNAFITTFSFFDLNATLSTKFKKNYSSCSTSSLWPYSFLFAFSAGLWYLSQSYSKTKWAEFALAWSSFVRNACSWVQNLPSKKFISTCHGFVFGSIKA